MQAARAQTGLKFYGWWGIVAATFIILWTTNGLTVGGITAFDKSLLELLKVGQGPLKFGDTIMLLTTAVCTLGAGWVADRYGVRPVMVVGVLALAAAFYRLGHASTLGEVYWMRFVMGISLSCAGLATCVVIVSRWFVGLRGTALGIMLAGTSLGNALFPGLTTGWIGDQGWRTASTYVAVLPLLLLPLILFAIKEWPSRLGLSPYPAATGDGVAPTARTVGEPPGYAEILRRKEFWFLGIAAFSTFYSILALSYNLFRHGGDMSLSPGDAAKLFFPLFLGGLIGKLAMGVVSDFLGRPTTWLIGLGCMLAGALLLTTLNRDLLLVAIGLFGLGWGGNYTLLQAATADAFDARSFGRVMGAITVLDAGGGAIGPWITGLLYDRYGSFKVGFGVVAALIGIAILMVVLVGRSAARAPIRA